jgi:hypothetical protein
MPVGASRPFLREWHLLRPRGYLPVHAMVCNSIHHPDLLPQILRKSFRGEQKPIVMRKNLRKRLGSLKMIEGTVRRCRDTNGNAWHPPCPLLRSHRSVVSDWNGFSILLLNIIRGLVEYVIVGDVLGRPRPARMVAHPSLPFLYQYPWVQVSVSVLVLMGKSSSAKGTNGGLQRLLRRAGCRRKRCLLVF